MAELEEVEGRRTESRYCCTWCLGASVRLGYHGVPGSIIIKMIFGAERRKMERGVRASARPSSLSQKYLYFLSTRIYVLVGHVRQQTRGAAVLRIQVTSWRL